MINLIKLLNFIKCPKRFDYLLNFLEFKLNKLKYNEKPKKALTFEEFLKRKEEVILFQREAEIAIKEIQNYWHKRVQSINNNLPYPAVFNADKILAFLVYIYTRLIYPTVVLETGVAYGITTSLILKALYLNNCGKLISIDFPRLSDFQGKMVGLGIPENLKKRWALCLSRSRNILPPLLSKIEQVDMFVSDSVNIFTLQRYEWTQVYPKMSSGGVLIFNNVSQAFIDWVKKYFDVEGYIIWSEEKKGEAIGIYFKN